jgi:hypothetical protein
VLELRRIPSPKKNRVKKRKDLIRHLEVVRLPHPRVPLDAYPGRRRSDIMKLPASRGGVNLKFTMSSIIASPIITSQTI